MVFPKYVKVRQERFGAVVFDTLKEKVFVSNLTGADILRLLGDGKSVNDIWNELCQNYEGSPAELNADINNFIDELRRKDILV